MDHGTDRCRHYTNDSEAIRDLIRRAQERTSEIEGEQGGETERLDFAAFRRRKAAQFGLTTGSARWRSAIGGDVRLFRGAMGSAQALRYIDLIEAARGTLAEAPPQPQDCAHIRPGYRRRGIERHVICFRATDYGVAVIRILHQRMDAGRHL